jgi:molybdate transport system regulatory protein
VKTSARNQFQGKVVSVEKGAVGAVVKVDTDSPCRITAFITKEAVDDLKIRKGDRVAVIIKSTEVMVGKED